MKKIVRNLMLLSVATAMFTACGKEPEVTKQGDVTIENGAIKAAFSVSDSKQVYFSQGNLQYQASTDVWRFAENQWDYVGTQIIDPDALTNSYIIGGTVNGSDNAYTSEIYDGWIDLYGWGTSGFNGKNPYWTSTGFTDYGDGENDIAGTNYDWGVNNAISNGGKQAGLWRTLTDSEWNYLIFDRAQANHLMGQGNVNNVNGLILLPDDWETSSSVKFTYEPRNYSTNVYSLDEWAIMQSYGAVFLPAAGCRAGTRVYSGVYGNYWSSSADGGTGAHDMRFESDTVNTYSGFRDFGISVRLVQDVQ